MRKIIFIIFIFLILNFFSVSAIKISPTQQTLKMEVGETNCTNIWVLPHENFIITSKWSLNGNGDLSKYNLSSEKIKLKINQSYLSDGKYQFCFTPEKGGNFSGIIYFYSERTLLEIGSWIDINVEDQNVLEKISLITGNVIGNKERETNVLLSIVFILLVVILVLLIRKLYFFTKTNIPK